MYRQALDRETTLVRVRDLKFLYILGGSRGARAPLGFESMFLSLVSLDKVFTGMMVIIRTIMINRSAQIRAPALLLPRARDPLGLESMFLSLVSLEKVFTVAYVRV